LRKRDESDSWVLGHLNGWSYAPTVPTLCAACVPTQPNWAELRYAQRDNDGEKLVTQRASNRFGGGGALTPTPSS
jgi:hypothetical protein